MSLLIKVAINSQLELYKEDQITIERSLTESTLPRDVMTEPTHKVRRININTSEENNLSEINIL